MKRTCLALTSLFLAVLFPGPVNAQATDARKSSSRNLSKTRNLQRRRSNLPKRNDEKTDSCGRKSQLRTYCFSFRQSG